MNGPVQHGRSQHHTGTSFAPSLLSILRTTHYQAGLQPHQKSAEFYVLVAGKVPDFAADFPQNSSIMCRVLVLIYVKKLLEFGGAV